jgi:hypothetical protein
VIVDRLGALLLLAATAAPVMALAQGYGAPPPPPPAGAARGHWDKDAMRERMHDHEAARSRALHDVLRIRPDQEAAFQAYLAAMHPLHAPGEHADHAMPQDHAAMAQLTTPQRLDRMAQMMDERETRRRAAFEKHATAVKALYAALSPEQQHTFDALPQLEGHGWGGRGWHEGGDMGRGPHGPGEMAPMGPPPPQGD